MITYYLDDIYIVYSFIKDLIDKYALGYYHNYKERITIINFANEESCKEFITKKNTCLKNIDLFNKCLEVQYEN